MEYKLYDSELKLLEILWDSGELPARDVAAQAADSFRARSSANTLLLW